MSSELDPTDDPPVEVNRADVKAWIERRTAALECRALAAEQERLVLAKARDLVAHENGELAAMLAEARERIATLERAAKKRR